MSYTGEIGQYQTPEPKGWICPKCGAVMANWQPYCIFCKPNVTNIEQAKPTIKEREIKEDKAIADPSST